MVFDEKKYTEDSIIKQLTLIQLHSTDGSALESGCSCIEGKHLHALEGLSEEAIMTATDPQEKAFYEDLANLVREKRKAIEEQKFDNPGPGRKYLPHGLTECEKTHPHVLRKLSRCIKKVEKREGCSPPYADCPVNPVAVCRASVHCPNPDGDGEEVAKNMDEKLDEQTIRRLKELQLMSLEQIREVQKRCEADHEYELGSMFRSLRRGDELELRKLKSTSYPGGSRINEINFNIAYEKYVPG